MKVPGPSYTFTSDFFRCYGTAAIVILIALIIAGQIWH
jgi:hypothetical protein